jgi:DNA-binding MurR/RpiR family transcriptional regulator
MDVGGRITEVADTLTKAERRVAEVVLAQPELVAFGTVADLASAAEAGAATVVRLATKVGFDGFTDLQQSVRFELAGRLRPAAERIREPAADDPVSQHLHLERSNVEKTLGDIDAGALGAAVALLADPARSVFVLSGEASTGIAHQLRHDLGSLRPHVEMLGGNEVRVLRRLAMSSHGDVVIAIDLRRYDRWVVETAQRAKDVGMVVISISDSRLSPIAAMASASFVVAASGAGPFDSHVGTLALANLLVTSVSAVLRGDAVHRLDRAERAWNDAGALSDR